MSDPATSAPPKTGDRSTVQSLHRAIALMDELAGTRVPRSAAELAALTGLDRTVVHRLLRTLRVHGLVEHRDGRYILGARTLVWGGAAVDHLIIKHAALPYAVDLQARLVGDRPWVVSVGVPAGDVVVIIDQIWTTSMPLDIVGEIGHLLPIRRSSMGRSILAYWGDERRIGLVDESDRDLRARLELIREAGGVEVSSGEIREGISSVAAAILSRGEEAVGAIAISGPNMGRELARDSNVAQHLRRVAERIGRSLH